MLISAPLLQTLVVFRLKQLREKENPFSQIYEHFELIKPLRTVLLQDTKAQKRSTSKSNHNNTTGTAA
jgi:hypothetical protein